LDRSVAALVARQASRRARHNATTDIDGLSSRSRAVVSFITRQLLDIASPSNFPWTNPEIGRVTLEQGGRNLVQGFQNALDDWQRFALGQPPVGPLFVSAVAVS
jgi:polyhydroxyalkanoate synthase subunit PhaC